MVSLGNFPEATKLTNWYAQMRTGRKCFLSLSFDVYIVPTPGQQIQLGVEPNDGG